MNVSTSHTEPIIRFIDIATQGPEPARVALVRGVLHDSPAAEKVVREIAADVRSRGDAALLELGRRFDSPDLDSIEVGPDEWAAADDVAPALASAMQEAARRITWFHERQGGGSWMEPRDGVLLGQLVRPLDCVGVYVPGGRALYPSSVLMCAIPARVAGVPEIIICTPAGAGGRVHPAVLFAARLAGVRRVFKVGGAQAVAAMAYGAGAVPKVDKIVGPGNAYVNLAKRALWGEVDMDMLAGPSEVCVLADGNAPPDRAAADMLTQAEHDADAAAFLLTPSLATAERVVAELDRQARLLGREGIIRQSLRENGAVIVTRSMDEAVDLANLCAPEHLTLMVGEPMALLGRIRHAGAILLGAETPQTYGDYLAGPSHTLPTSGAARFASPINVETFRKRTSVIGASAGELAAVAGTLIAYAEAEGFGGHAAAVRIRTGTGKEPGDE